MTYAPYILILSSWLISCGSHESASESTLTEDKSTVIVLLDDRIPCDKLYIKLEIFIPAA